jgi:hypothetical protein
MAIRKYQSVENTKVLNKDQHSRVGSFLHKLGKQSANDLTDEEREALSKVAKSDQA